LSRAKRKALKLATDNTIHFNDFVAQRKTVALIPKTINQETYIELLTDDSKPIIYASGPAGTGKTMLAVMAGVKAYKEGRVEKLILTRPAVGVEDEKHGFLPGDLVSKMEPWTRPILDVMLEYYSPKEITRMIDEQRIEISPLAFMRGRNFKRCWIIADEMQNATPSQLKMLLTRLGDGSKIVITGDLNQTDKRAAENGLLNFLKLLSEHGAANYIAGIQFNSRDIQRHPAVKEILAIYKELV
jgi:phosphate starvation-inducible PhoH-like protein